MLTGSYRKRLDADLQKWVAAGVIDAGAAAAIRKHAADDAGGVRLPAILGMMGGLLLAASVAAFVAANWDVVPRVGKLGAILAAIITAFVVHARYAARGARLAADAAATCGTLVFGAGVALVGQMYHLPADWPAGALLVGIGALAAAALLRSDGALITALACGVAWMIGVAEAHAGATNWRYLLFYLPALWLAFGRAHWSVHNAAVLAGAAWLVMVAGSDLGRDAALGTHIAYLLFVSCAFIALGLLAEEGRLPALLAACTPWGLLGYAVVIALQLMRILDAAGGVPGHAATRVIVAGVVALGAIAAMLALASERKGAFGVAVALLAAMATSIAFWGGLGASFTGKVLVSALVVLSAAAMVAAGAATGQRRISITGAAAFGLAVLVLLWRTVGSLIDQSLFFLAGGAALLLIAALLRRLIQRFSPGAKVAS